ncbi:MAG: hypothetical protein BGO61_11575 [Thiobacillus sp. 65-69]|nr:alpha-2-macroglobulin [Thiobacillus sp.]ODU91249.1 MAG: hypothetical protein ABT21_04410 [Thiobacillus sp. SCN 65-179]OJW38151.1 MAG: hypothetical protein BGO61_11575 [Thiobacillus sp. 65-69]
MRTWLTGILLGWAFAAGAASVTAFSPEGTAKGVRQASARFDAPMTALGDPRQADPFVVDCSVPGSGKWLDERTWVYDFERDLPGATRCVFVLREGLKDAAGQALAPRTFHFDTGGPQVLAVRPWEGGAVDERQIFLLAFDARVKPGTLAERAACRVRGLADRIEVEVLQGTQREAALAPFKDRHDPLFRRRFAPSAETTEALRCKRPLPNDAEVSLLIEPGVEAGNGLASTEAHTFDFRVRPAFRLRAVCDKVNARADCNPLGDIRVALGGSIRRDAAATVRLSGAGRSWQPVFDGDGPWVDGWRFKGPFPEKAALTLTVPAGLADADGRALVNASQLPLALRTDAYPPLAKFAGHFGVIEAANPVLPVTLRNLETDAADRALALPARMASVREGGDAMVIGWLRHLQSVRYGRTVPNPDPKKAPQRQPANTFPVLENVKPLAEFAVPKPGGGKAFEVVGIPLPGPGFYVVEAGSPRLGAAYLDGKGAFYVHTAALVTNLVAHTKIGRESSLVWVTALDSGLPVAKADVAVSDCTGKPVWQGATDAQGRAAIGRALGEVPHCRNWPGGWFVSARVGADRTFTLSSWNDGIEPWRFNLPPADVWTPDIAHSVLDRSLLRAGDTLAMKHFLRTRTGSGFAVPSSSALPTAVTFIHAGSGQRTSLPVKFDARGTAETQWAIPREARLGAYDIVLERGKRSWNAGHFNVSAFRLPTMRAQIGLPDTQLVRARSAAVDVGVQYLAGGGASGLPVKLRSLVEPLYYTHPDFPGAAFGNGGVKTGIVRDETVYGNFDAFEEGADPLPEAVAEPARTWKATLDRAGAARIVVDGLAPRDTLAALRLELDYADASGATQTASQRITLWPGARVPGIAIPDWNASGPLRYDMAVIDAGGRAVPGARVESDIFLERTYSHRKRLVGGFYAYENVRELTRVAAGCAGATDARGRFACSLVPPARGSLVVRVKTVDPAGNAVYAHRDVWVPGSDEAWFAGSDPDRMDVLPERPAYEPGQTAELQVKLPYREATALVTVEREGVLDSFVVPLSAARATVKLPVKAHYAPNVTVSVLAVRGRVGEPAPTALVDLGKPAYKLGAANLRVGTRAHALTVEVKTPGAVYKVRDTVPVSIRVARADGGKLPAGAEVAVAAVDEALLELAPNPSWKLLDAMMASRPWEVDTATAQMQVVGKRHFGRKSLPPGGGGGKLPTRELFDTRVLWQARVKLDGNGRAQLKVPLNDSLTSFRIVAVANAGVGYFGDGAATVRTHQDLMLLSGLPPVVRADDAFPAEFTVRNGSDKALTATLAPTLKAQGTTLATAPQTVTLAPGEARALVWPVAVPAQAGELVWHVEVAAGTARDALEVRQTVLPAVPVRAVQATLFQLDGNHTLPVVRPAGALPGLGGITVAASSRLAGDLSAMRDYMRTYPYTCTEQRISRALALDDAALWAEATGRLSASLDGNGLARYFPNESLPGDSALTAYILSSAHAARRALPDDARSAMLEGLKAYVAGRVRDQGIGFADRTVRRLGAIAALARYGEATPDMLDAVVAAPGQWPSSALLDYIGILQRLASVPDREAKLKTALDSLRVRMDLRGTTLNWTTDARDRLWWLMVSPDLNAARALETLIDEPALQAELPRLARGLMARQKQGRWDLTTANAWARIALDRFGERFEPGAVSGQTRVALESETRTIAWPQPAPVVLPWPAAPAGLHVSQQGTGKPWITVTSRAALPLKAPLASGYTVRQTVAPVAQAVPGRWSRGDIARVTVTVDAQADMSWVVVDAPVPAGATLLGSGLGGESALAAREAGGAGRAWLAYEERPFDRYRAYYAWVPKGRFTVDYVVRLNTPGTFRLPPTRVEAMYQPEQFGELPNADWVVMP